MSTPDTTGSNDSARDASSSRLAHHVRGAIEIFFYRTAGATYLCSGAGCPAPDWRANLLATAPEAKPVKNPFGRSSGSAGGGVRPSRPN